MFFSSLDNLLILFERRSDTREWKRSQARTSKVLIDVGWSFSGSFDQMERRVCPQIMYDIWRIARGVQPVIKQYSSDTGNRHVGLIKFQEVHHMMTLLILTCVLSSSEQSPTCLLRGSCTFGINGVAKWEACNWLYIHVLWNCDVVRWVVNCQMT